ncbi:uncharacterized protein DS421_17g579560 [Arachis hypogaea]|nr:uncharacterized protein DS421_17g579560 [Arachis hypogaea]
MIEYLKKFKNLILAAARRAREPDQKKEEGGKRLASGTMTRWRSARSTTEKVEALNSISAVFECCEYKRLGWRRSEQHSAETATSERQLQRRGVWGDREASRLSLGREFEGY